MYVCVNPYPVLLHKYAPVHRYICMYVCIYVRDRQLNNGLVRHLAQRRGTHHNTAQQSATQHHTQGSSPIPFESSRSSVCDNIVEWWISSFSHRSIADHSRSSQNFV